MAEEQLGFDLGRQTASGPVYFDPADVRADLTAMLTDARNATVQSPWDERTLRYNRIVFPQMAKWLPEEEAEQFCFAFRQEIERLELLLAA